MEKTPRTRLREIIRQATALAILIVVVFAARSSLADHYIVPTGSMWPTVHVGDRVVVNKLAYGLRFPFTNAYIVDLDDPERGDVIVFESPDDSETLLKRVVAVPGDEVTVLAGRVFINGVRQEPEAFVSFDNGTGPEYGPVVVPEDRFFVLGDNRGDSRDGRYFGMIRRSTILGRAEAVFYRGGFTWNPL